MMTDFGREAAPVRLPRHPLSPHSYRIKCSFKTVKVTLKTGAVGDDQESSESVFWAPFHDVSPARKLLE